MKTPLHILNGDAVGDMFSKTGIAGDILVWRDVLYEGIRSPGVPDSDAIKKRALFLESKTGGGLSCETIEKGLQNQYSTLEKAAACEIVLWCDACLFDQAMFAHILACLHHFAAHSVELLCIDSFPGISPYNGLGQLTPQQLASSYENRVKVTQEQYDFATKIDAGFAAQDIKLLTDLMQAENPPLPYMPAAIKRWLQELPDPETGLGRLETLALHAIKEESKTPKEIFKAVARADTPPQWWGDTTLWERINGLAKRNPPLVVIQGPADTLPLWQGGIDINDFQIVLNVK